MTGSTALHQDPTGRLLFVVDLAGVFVFALEGALAGMAAGLGRRHISPLSRSAAAASAKTNDPRKH